MNAKNKIKIENIVFNERGVYNSSQFNNQMDCNVTHGDDSTLKPAV